MEQHGSSPLPTFSEDNQKYLIPLILPETYVPFVPSSSENGQEKTTQQAINRTLS
jgi:hypothetical protein